MKEKRWTKVYVVDLLLIIDGVYNLYQLHGQYHESSYIEHSE